MGILRLVLAICVIVVHTAPIGGVFPLIGGRPAVQIFYMISGFYMALVLNEKYADSRQGRLLFYRNRLLRIFPPYLFVLAIAFVVGLAIHADAIGYWTRFGARLTPVTLAALVITNISVVGQDVMMFMKVDPASGALFPAATLNSDLPAWHFLLMPQTWSISLELIFYAIAPFLVRRRMRVIVGLIGLSLLTRVLLSWKAGLLTDPWNYRFFPSEIATFLTGVVLYRAYRRLREANRLPDRSAGWVCLGALILLIVVLPQWLPVRLLIACIYSAAALSMALIFDASRDSAVDRYIGELSYPLYLLHSVVLSVLTAFNITAALPCILLSLAASVVVQRFLDRPLDAIRHAAPKPSELSLIGANAHRG